MLTQYLFYKLCYFHFILKLILISIIATSFSVSAWATVFDIEGVEVDVTSLTAADARKQALIIGEKSAFYSLLNRLTLLNDRDRLPRLNDKQISYYVKDFEVVDEKNSSVRYLATLNYRFKVKEVRELLANLDIAFAESVSEPLLILPIFQSSKIKRLWDDPNPWREAWEKNNKKIGLVPLTMPRGDLRDIGIISAEQALSADVLRLNELAKVYKTSSIAAVHSILSKDQKNLFVLEIFVSVHNRNERTLIKPIKLKQKIGEKDTELLGRAVNRVADLINNKWKEANILDLDQSNIAAFTVPITGLNDWLKIKNKLKRVFLVTKIEMVLLSLDEVRINIHYMGKMRQLDNALLQSNLSLVKEDSELVLYLSGKAQ